MNKLLLAICFLITGCVQNKNDHTFQITKIGDGVYMHTSFKEYESYGWVDSNGLVVVKNNKAVMVDTPWSEEETAELASWISTQGFTLKASISTHFHEDRTAGIAWLNSQSIPTYTSELTDRLLKQKNKPRAGNIFYGDSMMMLDGSIEVYYPGAGHSQDNLVVWLSDNHMLFGGCLVRSLEWHSLGNTTDANISQWPGSVTKIQHKYPIVKKVVPGHGKVGDASILSHTIRVANKTINTH